MLLSNVGSLIILKNRRLVQIIPENLIKIWDEWEIRVMVLLSLLLQVLLFAFGSRRKYNGDTKLRFMVWSAYLAADWAAIFSLGLLSQMKGDYSAKSYGIKAFWAPFLLLHLGGADTITAYSLEDNELWARHLMTLAAQVLGAIYVFILSWTGTRLNYLGFFMFAAGVIKYGERIWILWSASSNGFRDSMIGSPYPGPNYARFMDEYCLKEDEGFIISLQRLVAPGGASLQPAGVESEQNNNVVSEAADSGEISAIDEAFAAAGVDHQDSDQFNQVQTLRDSFRFFRTFKMIFADLILTFQDREDSQAYFWEASWSKAFRVIELELGFIYDMLYTKANVNYSKEGTVFRIISFSATIFTFVAFCIMEKHGYPKIDVWITGLLLVGAIVLEFSAIFRLLSSDWTKYWVDNHPRFHVLYGKISCLPLFLQSIYLLPSDKQWSDSVAQFNLLNFCLKYKSPDYSGFLEPPHDRVIVPENLKSLIFELLKHWSTKIEQSRSRTTPSDNRYKLLWEYRGEQTLQEMNGLALRGWIVEVEFDQSIILWHIATDICSSLDQQNFSIERDFKRSKYLSNYMLYLLFMRPSMLPKGIGKIRFRDTCAEAILFFQEFKHTLDWIEACKELYAVNTKVQPSYVKGDGSKSVLFEACRLAKCLQALEATEKWKLISSVWVEMLSHAASRCESNHHAQQLRRGGELLTHVWLLMAHLGVTDHFKISQGDARLELQAI